MTNDEWTVLQLTSIRERLARIEHDGRVVRLKLLDIERRMRLAGLAGPLPEPGGYSDDTSGPPPFV